MASIIVLIWGIFNFLILWLLLHAHLRKSWRNSFISTSLLYGVGMYVLAELLSVFEALNTITIFAGCITYTLVCLLLLRKAYKANKLICPRIQYSLSTIPIGLYFLAFILLTTLFLAIAYPPNTWDSLTYHLPKVEHWIQNSSFKHYYTSIDRQLFSAPLAEISIMYGRILTEDDWLMNLTQWFSFLGILIVISKIAEQLQLNKKMQLVAALFFATVPMAILQSTSTQNDLVVTFWLVCALERFLAWYKDKKLLFSLEFGVALGLAILTKGTAYTIGLPLVIVYAIICIRQYRKLLPGAILTASILLIINAPHYIRNYATFENPIHARAATVSSFSLEAFTITLFSNIYTNIPVPVYKPEKLNEILSSKDKQIFPYGPLNIRSVKESKCILKESLIFHEDVVKNTFHTLLILLSIIVLVSSKSMSKKRYYALLVIACFCSFSFSTPWQPWITRLQLPLFAFCAPLFAQAFSVLRFTKTKYCVLTVICIFALLPLFMNYTRPLIYTSKTTPILGGRVSDRSIWNTSRAQLVFSNNVKAYQAYSNNCNKIIASKNTKVGLIIGGDIWEYPIWRYLRGSNVSQISHQKINEIDEDIECIFLYDYNDPEEKTTEFTPEILKNQSESPLILVRNPEDNSKWQVN